MLLILEFGKYEIFLTLANVITFVGNRIAEIVIDHSNKSVANILTPHSRDYCCKAILHYGGAIMSAMAFQITGVSIVCTAVCSGADKRKHQSYVSLALWGIRNCFHLMMSSWRGIKTYFHWDISRFDHYQHTTTRSVNHGIILSR